MDNCLMLKDKFQTRLLVFANVNVGILLVSLLLPLTRTTNLDKKTSETTKMTTTTTATRTIAVAKIRQLQFFGTKSIRK